MKKISLILSLCAVEATGCGIAAPSAGRGDAEPTTLSGVLSCEEDQFISGETWNLDPSNVAAAVIVDGTGQLVFDSHREVQAGTLLLQATLMNLREGSESIVARYEVQGTVMVAGASCDVTGISTWTYTHEESGKMRVHTQTMAGGTFDPFGTFLSSSICSGTLAAPAHSARL